MVKILEYGYTDWNDYSLSKKQCIYWKDADDGTECEWMSWYEVGQILGGN